MQARPFRSNRPWRHGACQVYGHGRYPALLWGLDDRISSGRRILDRCPYSQNPNWQR